MTAAIEVDGLRKTFGSSVAVDSVDLTVAAGEVVGLLGPNGAGKTTTINCLTTLIRADSGRLRVCGYDVGVEPAKVRASIAVTGQFAAVDAMLTGRQNLVFFGRLLGLRRRAARRRAEALLAHFGLADAASKRVRAYSGGMRRRLDLAVSLVVPRPVLFLDEPTTGLDPGGRRDAWSAVRELRDGGSAVLLTTQYLEEADQLADRIIVLDRGRVIAAGSAKLLREKVGGAMCEIRLADATDRDRAIDALADLPGLNSTAGPLVLPAPDTRALMDIVRRLDSAGVEPAELERRQPTLDEVFLTLTGHQSAAPST